MDIIAKTGDHGTPAGHLYVAFASFGCTLELFNQFMSILEASGKIVKRRDSYFATTTKEVK